MAHVRDVHADAVALRLAASAGALDRERVVEVLGVGSVDREGRDLAVVGAAAQRGLGHRGAEALRRLQHVFAELVLEAVLDDDRAGLDLGVVGDAEHLGDLGEGFLLARRLRPHHAADDAGAGLDGADRFGRQQDALPEAHRVGAQDGVATGVLEGADHLVVAALRRARVGPGEHPVAVPGAEQLVGGHEQVLGRALVGDHEAVPAGRDLQPAPDQVHVLGEPVGAPPRANEVAIGDERVQDLLQLVPVVDRQLLLDVLNVPGALRVLVEVLEDSCTVGSWHHRRA